MVTPTRSLRSHSSPPVPARSGGPAAAGSGYGAGMAWEKKARPAGDMDGACEREPGAQAAARRSLEAGLEHRRRLPARLSDPRAFLCLRARPHGFPGLASSGRFVPLPVPELFPELLECWVMGRPTGRPWGVPASTANRTHQINRPTPARASSSVEKMARCEARRLMPRPGCCPFLIVVSPHRIVAWIV